PDYREVEIRKNQLAVVAERIKGKESASIVLGDLNAPKEDAALSPFVERLKDSKDFTGETFGATFNGFGSVDSDDALNGIDFIFLPKQAIVEKTGVVKSVPNGVYPSDHFPIFAKVRL
ncbi:MAG: hypothetical protein IJP68_00895, partial [Selenomonadaceae bacterium]|nr:hypothetical protein [Selenomonadaceae bacterium]